MRSIAEWLEGLTHNTEVATVLGSIPAFSDTVESEGRQMNQHKKIEKNPPVYLLHKSLLNAPIGYTLQCFSGLLILLSSAPTFNVGNS
jgi:hypothetical protein